MRETVSGNCTACPQGTYSDMIEASSCTPCPEGLTTRYDASDEATDCIGRNITVFKILLIYLEFETNNKMGIFFVNQMCPVLLAKDFLFMGRLHVMNAIVVSISKGRNI